MGFFEPVAKGNFGGFFGGRVGAESPKHLRDALTGFGIFAVNRYFRICEDFSGRRRAGGPRVSFLQF